jgi:PAS domain S-box-containing protein
MKLFIEELIESLCFIVAENARYRASLGCIMCNPSMEPIAVLSVAIRMYPEFLKSSIYKKLKDLDSMEKMESINEKCLKLVHMSMINPAEISIAQKAMSTVDLLEVDRLLQSGSWLASMLAAVESLPVGVSLATASKERMGFPLIYVNECFAQITGYARSEIVGQNCRFLQAGKAEQDSIDRLTTALRGSKPIRIAITNFRKDGMPFKNLLAMKPIFSEAGQCEYVVGVHFDVTQDHVTPDKLKLADQVLQMLPNIISINRSSQIEEE